MFRRRGTDVKKPTVGTAASISVVREVNRNRGLEVVGKLAGAIEDSYFRAEVTCGISGRVIGLGKAANYVTSMGISTVNTRESGKNPTLRDKAATIATEDAAIACHTCTMKTTLCTKPADIGIKK